MVSSLYSPNDALIEILYLFLFHETLQIAIYNASPMTFWQNNIGVFKIRNK